MTRKKSKFAVAFEARESAEPLVRAPLRTSRPCTAIETRNARRFDHAEPAALLTQAGVKSAMVCNISASGAGLFRSEGHAPEVGELLSLMLFDNRYIQACVVWVDDSRFGLKFDDEVICLDEILHFELRGSELLHAILRCPKNR